MKPTLYEALGLSQTAAPSEIKAALRRLVRRYYTKTRAGHTDVEEALRFLNHASHVLGNPQRRAEYDSELAKGIRTESSLTTVGEMSAHEVGRPQSARESEYEESPSPIAISITALEYEREKPPPDIEAIPEWTAQLADFRRTRAGQLAGLLVAVILLGIVWNLSLPLGGATATVLKFATLGTIMTVIVAGFIYALVHALSQSIWKPPLTESAITIVEGMIPRWRRDRTVFMGTGGPVEDATWLFRLRMAELKRVSAERVSDPQPLMRLFARLFDYGFWGIVLLGLLGLLRLAGSAGELIADVLAHPLVLPIFITLSWIPIEGLLLAQIQTTPGRWLLCVYLHYQVSNPYAPEELRFTFAAAVRRALEVWWRGCGAGLPLVSMVTVARAREHIGRSGETPWDSERDCLVTHGPVGTLSLVSLAIGLIAATLAFASWWLEPTQTMVSSGQRMYASVVERLTGDREPASAAATAQPRIARVDDVAQPPRVPAEPETKRPRAVTGQVQPSTGKVASQASTTPTPSPSTARQISVPVVVQGGATAQAPSTAADPAAAARARSSGARSAWPSISSSRNGCRHAATSPEWRRHASAGRTRTGEIRARSIARLSDCRASASTGRPSSMFNRAGALLTRDDPLKLMIDDAVVRSFRAESGR